jgi:hypothetical protein
MRISERLKAVRESAFERRKVGGIAGGLMRYRCDNREHILDAMVGLLKQSPLPVRSRLPLADVPKKTNKQRVTELIAGSD